MARIVTTAYESCYKLLSENRALMDTMVERLIEKENIDYDELTRMRDEHFKNKVPAAASA